MSSESAAAWSYNIHETSSTTSIPLTEPQRKIIEQLADVFAKQLNTGVSVEKVVKYIYKFLYAGDYIPKQVFDYLQHFLSDKEKPYYALLGFCYEFGIGTKVDLDKAVKLYQQGAAVNGDVYSQNFLGLRFLDGMGVQRDPKKAYYWLKQSARIEFSTGQYNLAHCYQYGIGVEKNIKKSLFWYTKSADNGHTMASCAIGHIYRYGIGTRKNEMTAFESYRKSAEAGSEHGQHNIADCFRLGIGCSPDPEKAFYWEKKAAMGGNTTAQCGLSSFYAYGIGTKRDDRKAVYWYRRAAQEESLGQIGLSAHYANARGTLHDIHEAIRWARRSKESYPINHLFLGLPCSA